ncbi:MAG: recombination protein RecT [Deltaproteobacteria bacterium]|nr:recombination protein RecT [Deltaproteobacteria bacterium]
MNKKNTSIVNQEATTQKLQVVQDWLRAQNKQIQMALPRHMDANRLTRVVLTNIRQVPRLLECDIPSLMGAVVQCAQLGLEPDSALGHVYLLPYRDNKRKQTTCQVIIGYRGMIDLARRSGNVVSIAAHVVFENDRFDFQYGLNEQLDHVPHRGADRGEPIYVYAVARMKGGGHAFEVLTMDDVDRAKASSQSANSNYSPWKTHWVEMARKTAIRRLFKYLPVSVEIARAVGLDEMAENDIPQNLDVLVTDDAEILDEETGEVIPSPTEAKADELADQLDDAGVTS